VVIYREKFAKKTCEEKDSSKAKLDLLTAIIKP
jgi:hypothetical protein